MRKPAASCDSDWKQTKPVPGAVRGASIWAKQCMCSGVYLIILLLSSPAATCLSENVGIVWNLLHPSETMRGSWFFSTLLYHLCFFSLTCTIPVLSSCAVSPPTTISLLGSKCRTNSQGTPVSFTRTYAPGVNPTYCLLVSASSSSNSSKLSFFWASSSALAAIKSSFSSIPSYAASNCFFFSSFFFISPACLSASDKFFPSSSSPPSSPRVLVSSTLC
mmetsp:Transcript_40693/g.128299  ORF Transcript_40693/g.128299 Transcript_40693/m.128299 type:complete len:219 (+) Transcript_40693:411-1067(+)